MRLDGSTPMDKRKEAIAAFSSPYLRTLVFLLSAQAGGMGLNLVSASSLISMDVSWNPAIDKQALARVWRDGQKKRTTIYRLLSAHTVEEKILQRQLLKESYAQATALGGASSTSSSSNSSSAAGNNSGNSKNAISAAGFGGRESGAAGGAVAAGGGAAAGGAGGGMKFSRAELRDLFSMNPSAAAPCDSIKVVRKATLLGHTGGPKQDEWRGRKPAAAARGGGKEEEEEESSGSVPSSISEAWPLTTAEAMRKVPSGSVLEGALLRVAGNDGGAASSSPSSSTAALVSYVHLSHVNMDKA